MFSSIGKRSAGNPWSQSWRRKGRLRREGFAEKEGFKRGINDRGSDGWWERWVDGIWEQVAVDWCRYVQKRLSLIEHKLNDRRQDWKLDVLSAIVLANSCLLGPCTVTVDTHTHTRPFSGPFSRTTQVSRYQKGKTRCRSCRRTNNVKALKAKLSPSTLIIMHFN